MPMVEAILVVAVVLFLVVVVIWGPTVKKVCPPSWLETEMVDKDGQVRPNIVVRRGIKSPA